jgi:hypothetical protein
VQANKSLTKVTEGVGDHSQVRSAPVVGGVTFHFVRTNDEVLALALE